LILGKRPDPTAALYASPSPGAVRGYGIQLSGLPGRWPSCEGSEPLARLSWNQIPASPSRAEDRWSDERPDGFTIGWAGWAEYRVERSGDRGEVEVLLGGIDPWDAAIGLVLSVLPLALPLFDLEPLHGSAVTIGDRALLILGHSGAGKSTIAAGLRDRGFGFVTDDACAIDASGLLWPGPPLLATRDDGGSGRIRYDDKSVVPIQGHRADPLSVAGTIVLVPSSTSNLRVPSLSGTDALAAILGHVRSGWLHAKRRRALQLEVASLMSLRPVAAVEYRPEEHRPVDVVEAVAGWTSSTV
jgi:hypothetical protein